MHGPSLRVLGIDPGMSGGCALVTPDGVTLRKYTTEQEFLEFLRPLADDHRKTTLVVIEDVPPFVAAATSASSSFKLGYNFGYHVGVCRMAGFRVDLVRPQVWQKGIKGLKPKLGYTERKRILKDNACRKYPDLKVTHAVADALLIADWACAQQIETF